MNLNFNFISTVHGGFGKSVGVILERDLLPLIATMRFCLSISEEERTY